MYNKEANYTYLLTFFFCKHIFDELKNLNTLYFSLKYVDKKLSCVNCIHCTCALKFKKETHSIPQS